MSIPEILPWHAGQWRALASAMDTDRVHHAMLLQGAPGLGKEAFAERAAAALLCESAGPASVRPCGTCRSCLLVAAGTHPDRLSLSPEEDRSQITVEQVRERIAELALTPHYATRRAIVVTPAHALNRHAANTLLKTLEEPPGGAVFLLVSARPARLPATIRSRCTRLEFRAPPREQAVGWLLDQVDVDAAVAGALLEWCAGAPLAAVQAVRDDAVALHDAMASDLAAIMEGRMDVVQAAAGWRAHGLRQVVDWQLRIVVQAMRIKAMGDSASPSRAMQPICATLDLRRLDLVCEELLELGSALERQLNPGDQLALESLAVTWRDAARQPA